MLPELSISICPGFLASRSTRLVQYLTWHILAVMYVEYFELAKCVL